MSCPRCHHHGAAKSSFALTLGAAVGAMFGLLFAQRPGKELRSALSRAGEKKGVKGAAGVLGKELKGIGKDVASVSKDVVESEPVQHAVETGRAAVENVRERGRELLDRAEDKVEDVVEGVKESVKDVTKKFRKQ